MSRFYADIHDFGRVGLKSISRHEVAAHSVHILRMSTHRLRSASVEASPVFLPHTATKVADGGAITATLNGELVSSGLAPWSRSLSADLLDVMTLQGTGAVRADLHEVDGQVFTDIVQAAKRTVVKAAPRTRRMRRAGSSAPLVEMFGKHFTPGQEVAVAIAMRARSSTCETSPPGAAGVILFGRESGRTVARDLT